MPMVSAMRSNSPIPRFASSPGGFTREAWQLLRAALVTDVRTATLREVDVSSPYGETHIYHCNIATPDGQDPCSLILWQRRDGRGGLADAGWRLLAGSSLSVRVNPPQDAFSFTGLVSFATCGRITLVMVSRSTVTLVLGAISTSTSLDSTGLPSLPVVI